MILIDTNVLVDVLTGDSEWYEWSIDRFGEAVTGGAFINAIVVAELATRSSSQEQLSQSLDMLGVPIEPMDVGACFVAGAAFRKWIANGGRRGAMLPDLMIGGHATAADAKVLTRDPRRFRTYFPDLELITPDLPKND